MNNGNKTVNKDRFISCEIIPENDKFMMDFP